MKIKIEFIGVSVYKFLNDHFNDEDYYKQSNDKSHKKNNLSWEGKKLVKDIRNT